MTDNNRILLSPPHLSGTEAELVLEALRSNWIAPLGPQVDAFEAELAAAVGSGGALATVSGTAAIHLALIALGVGRGDTVICQSLTFAATANPIVYQGATPIFVDSERATWNIDPGALRLALETCATRGVLPKAILVVHLYGMPAKVSEIEAIAAEYDVPIVEDAAEALGSSAGSRRCGSMGRCSILSFNGNKIITTSGGGALLSHDAALIARARNVSQQARDPAPHYEHSTVGHNYRLSNILAAVGRAQLRTLEARVAARRRIHAAYVEFFASVPGVSLQPESPESAFSNRWLTAIVIDPVAARGVTRDTVRQTLESFNVESRPLWKPMHLQPVFRGCDFFGGNVSESLFADGLCLPSGSSMSSGDIGRVLDALSVAFDHAQRG